MTAQVAAADEDRLARAALLRLAEPDDPVLGAAVLEHGAAAVLGSVRDGRAVRLLGQRRMAGYQARLGDLDAAGDLERARRVGAVLLVPDDDEWPPSLDDLGDRRPIGLWVRGRAAGLRSSTGRAVAVVGSRACTAYGETVAAELAAGLGDRGWTVVSGAAYGIDGAAHRGALAVGGCTVAVLACGVDMAYPSAHHRLLDAVAQAGLVVSELPPGAHPTKIRFLGRNRLIAALSRGTVVVEAAHRSGALNTAGHAVELSRELMAVPGPVTSAMSAGCHRAIREMGATLVTDAAEVLDLVGELGVDAAPVRRGERRPHDDLDGPTLAVLEALPAHEFAGPASVARVAGLGLPEVLGGLAVLQAGGLAEARAGRWRRARP